ncbi:hypothetical protein Hanom_Chr03g00219011 [Helianthus anomalus]
MKKDSERNKKGIGSEYHQVPPPFEKKFTFYDDEKVKNAFNMVYQLSDNIDVTYSKSNDIGDSEVVGRVVESVLRKMREVFMKVILKMREVFMISPNHMMKMREVFMKAILKIQNLRKM